MKLARQHGLGIVLFITLALSARVVIDDLARKEASGDIHSAEQSMKNQEIAVRRSTEVGRGERDPLLEAATDPFKAVNFSAAAQMPIAPPAPAPTIETKPVAPQFPYQFFGRMVAVDGAMLTFLSRDNALVPIKVGSILEEVYRIDAITDKQISITYLPLNQQISIPMRSASE